MKNINVPVDDNVSDLIGDAAKRKGMLKSAFVKMHLDRIADREYQKQQMEDHKTEVKND